MSAPQPRLRTPDILQHLGKLKKDVRNLSNAVAPTDWTPTWLGSTTNPVIGNGSLTGRYFVLGKICFVYIDMVSGTTTTFGNGVYSFDLPIPPITDAGRRSILAAFVYNGTYHSAIGQVDHVAGLLNVDRMAVQ